MVGHVLIFAGRWQKRFAIQRRSMNWLRWGIGSPRTSFGVQIQARSPADQTFLIQLASRLDDAYYVPTPRAVAAGRFSEKVMDNYSATVMTNIVGPEGGDFGVSSCRFEVAVATFPSR